MHTSLDPEKATTIFLWCRSHVPALTGLPLPRLIRWILLADILSLEHYGRTLYGETYLQVHEHVLPQYLLEHCFAPPTTTVAVRLTQDGYLHGTGAPDLDFCSQSDLDSLKKTYHQALTDPGLWPPDPPSLPAMTQLLEACRQGLATGTPLHPLVLVQDPTHRRDLAHYWDIEPPASPPLLHLPSSSSRPTPT